MKTYPDITQGSQLWHNLKRGKVSASHFKDVLNSGNGRAVFMAKLLEENISNQTIPSYISPAMQWGTHFEAEARSYYEDHTGNDVTQVGWIEYNSYLGISPDGLIGEDGGLEIKCPLTSTHKKYFDGKKLPTTYKAQVQGSLWVTGRKWWDFVSYDPRSEDKFFCVRVFRDEKYIAKLEDATFKFIEELKINIDKELMGE